MPKSNRPRPDLLSVEEAALKLDVTERTVWNLIKNGKLSHTKEGGRIWISVVDLNRYNLIYKDPFNTHVFSSFPSTYAGPGFAIMQTFGTWEPSNPQYEVSVDLEDWWRFAAKPIADETEYEAIKTGIKNLIGSELPEHFSVRFKINQEALAGVLDQVVKSVEVPKLPTSKEDLQGEAMKHLIDWVLPHLQHAREEPRSYLRKAVKNFYIDCTRKVHPEIAFGGPDEVEVEMIRSATPRKGRFKDQNVDKDQLMRDLTSSDVSQSGNAPKRPKRKPSK